MSDLSDFMPQEGQLVYYPFRDAIYYWDGKDWREVPQEPTADLPLVVPVAPDRP